MISRRSFFAAVFAAGAAMPPLALAAAPAGAPQATNSTFYDTLLATMKDGPALGFQGRRKELAPAIRRAFDLPLMTRLMVGPQWAGLTPDQQQQLVAAFSEFSIATYASRFDDYSGERFVVEPTASTTTNGVIVHSKLVKAEGDSVQLDYLMHDTDSGWHRWRC